MGHPMMADVASNKTIKRRKEMTAPLFLLYCWTSGIITIGVNFDI